MAYQGYVALLDILGFSAQIKSKDSDQYINKYKENITEIINGKYEKYKEILDFIVFSDTILINTKDNSDKALFNIISACSYLFYLLLISNMPIRGCISFGNFTREMLPIGDNSTHESNILLAGEPIVEASNYEKKQKWIGIMLAPSVIKHNYQELLDINDKIGTKSLNQFIKKAQIPFDSDKEYSGFAILPMNLGFLDLVQFEIELAAELDKYILSSPEPSDQFKYYKTKEWFSKIFENDRKFIEALLHRDINPRF